MSLFSQRATANRKNTETKTHSTTSLDKHLVIRFPLSDPGTMEKQTDLGHVLPLLKTPRHRVLMSQCIREMKRDSISLKDAAQPWGEQEVQILGLGLHAHDASTRHLRQTQSSVWAWRASSQFCHLPSKDKIPFLNLLTSIRKWFSKLPMLESSC